MTWAAHVRSFIDVGMTTDAPSREKLRGGAAYAGGPPVMIVVLLSSARTWEAGYMTAYQRGPWAETPRQACGSAYGYGVLRLRSASPLFAQDEKGF
jgi:hypothetical protein